MFLLSGNFLFASFVPVGPATVSISYNTPEGVVTYSGLRDFNGSFPSDATILGGAPNIKAFNSVDTFGWRLQVPGAVYPGESVITNAFFKINNGNDYFPGILENTDVTITVSGMEFDEPASIDASTFQLHTLWDADQADLLPNPYNHLHNFRTATNPFRDFDAFVDAGIFTDFPHPAYSLGDVAPTIIGNGTTTLGYSLVVPYHLLRHLSEEHTGSQEVPPGLPAPHGFLEPFHFHAEYVVTPEPSSLLLLGIGAVSVLQRRRASRL